MFCLTSLGIEVVLGGWELFCFLVVPHSRMSFLTVLAVMQVVETSPINGYFRYHGLLITDENHWLNERSADFFLLKFDYVVGFYFPLLEYRISSRAVSYRHSTLLEIVYPYLLSVEIINKSQFISLYLNGLLIHISSLSFSGIWSSIKSCDGRRSGKAEALRRFKPPGTYLCWKPIMGITFSPLKDIQITIFSKL